jgi:hypothetical protein
MTTGIGDDQYRFSATNFIPSIQTVEGIHFGEWVPRLEVSGPLERGKIWFYDSPGVEYDQYIVKELPSNADSTVSWRVNNLAKIQANLSPAHIVSGEFLVNEYHNGNEGLSFTSPLPTTTDHHAGAYLGALKDQYYYSSGLLLETGFAFNEYTASFEPLGDSPYLLTPDGTQGSYYADISGAARRLEGIENLYLPPLKWHGRHEVKLGADLQELDFHRDFERCSISILREDGTLARLATFPGGPDRAQAGDFEAGLYAQDRWFPTSRWLLESGVRLDRDQLIPHNDVAPRVAATYALGAKRNTKLSAGAGLFYNVADLALLTRPESGERLDYFYASDGMTQTGPPAPMRFVVHESSLQMPRSANWSAGLEQKLPGSVYLRLDYLQRRTSNNFLFENTAPAPGTPPGLGTFVLDNHGQYRYDAAQITVRAWTETAHPLMVSYTRSYARANAVFDFNVDSVMLGQQQGGRLPWDSPNRLVAWGWAPFVLKSLVGYSVEYHTGFPFSAVNELQELVPPANSYRFPAYFNLTLSVERRFHVLGRYIALRGTVVDVTDNEDPFLVNNNLDARGSNGKPTFSGYGHTAITGRLRLLGKVVNEKKKDQTTETGQP